MQQLELEISELECTSDETRLGSTTLTFTGAALKESEFQALRAHCEEMQRPPAQVQRRRAEACKEPDPLPEHRVEDVIAHSLLQEHQSCARSALYGRVCQARELLADAVLGVPCASSGRQWYKFVFASLRPHTAYFMPVRPLYRLQVAVVSQSSGRVVLYDKLLVQQHIERVGS
eukprot:5904603-Amphidinium_carterae.1